MKLYTEDVTINLLGLLTTVGGTICAAGLTLLVTGDWRIAGAVLMAIIAIKSPIIRRTETAEKSA